MLRKHRGFMFWLVLTVIWMIFIFYKSAQSYQEQDIRPWLASWIPQYVIDHGLPHWEFNYDGGLVTWKKPYDFIEFFIRKGGHVTEYAILTFLWIMTLLSHATWCRIAIPVGAVLSILYAASDEWHQSFVPGRTGHAIDVAVDSVGVLVVSFLFILVLMVRSRMKKRRIS